MLEYIEKAHRYEIRHTNDKPQSIQAFIWKPNDVEDCVNVSVGVSTTPAVIPSNTDEDSVINIENNKSSISVFVTDLLPDENYTIGVLLLSCALMVPISIIIKKLETKNEKIPKYFSDKEHYLYEILMVNENYYQN